jgi:hypothetical protein
MGGIYQPRDGWYIYYIQGAHEKFLFRVPRSVAVSDFPEVIKRIEQAAIELNAARKQHPVYIVIEQNRSQVEKNPEMFLSLIQDGLIKQGKNKSERRYQYLLSQEIGFAERWIRVQRFWLNIVLEVFFFWGLTLFAFWPWLRNKGWLKTSHHFGFLPFLLFLPYYFGYASWTFTSIGPSGGVLYPWVICWFHYFPIWPHLDQWVFNTLPKVLESFSQSMGRPMFSNNGVVGPLGPITALLIGLVVFVLTQAIFIYWKRKNFAMQTTIGKTNQTPEEKNSQQDTKEDSVNRAP